MSPVSKNVLGGPLQPCCPGSKTGFYRDGTCHVGVEDTDIHAVCAIMTDSFLSYTKAQGNDLSTPRLDLLFPGLKAGDRWCLCASRWEEAYRDGIAPPVVLEATHESMLEVVPLKVLQAHAHDKPAPKT